MRKEACLRLFATSVTSFPSSNRRGRQWLDRQDCCVGPRAGAEVVEERAPGKARAVLRAFSEIDSNILIMVDGDDSIPLKALKDFTINSIKKSQT